MKQLRASKSGLAIAVCLAMATNGLCGSPWLEGFAFRRMLTVTNLDAIAANQVNVPILVKLTSSNFAFNHANANGLDVRFTEADGVTPLSFERERHSDTTQQAEYWVRLPLLPATAQTNFFIYHTIAPQTDAADPASVWDANYLFVHHLAQPQGSPAVFDSTVNALDGTNLSSVVLGAAGCVNGAASFLSAATIRLNPFTRPVPATIEVWFKLNARAGRFYTVDRPGFDTGYFFDIQSDGTLRSYVHTGFEILYLTGITPVSTNEWHYAADVYGDASPGRKIYLDGALDNSLDSGGTPNTFYDYERRIGGNNLNGTLDEIRLSKTARSAAWIQVQNASIRDQLLAYGEEERQPVWLEGFRYRRPITVTNTIAIRSDLTDFPILVRLTEANFNFFKSSADGADVRFTMEDGVTPLSFERERHNRDTSQAEYWVRLPKLVATGDNRFYLYHSPQAMADVSNPTNVWDANYIFVHHLAATGGATRVFDSTANAMTGTVANVALGVEGFINGGARENTGLAANRITMPAQSRPLSATVEMFFKPNAASAPTTTKTMLYISGANIAYYLGLTASSNLYSFVHQGNATYPFTGTRSLPRGQWHYAADIFSSAAGRKIYVNGELDTSWSNYNVPYAPWWVNQYLHYTFDGDIDEVRMSKSVRSADWIQAQNASMRDQLLEVGPMEFTDQGSILLIR